MRFVTRFSFSAKRRWAPGGTLGWPVIAAVLGWRSMSSTIDAT